MIDLETLDPLDQKVRLQTFLPHAIATFHECDKIDGRPITRIHLMNGAYFEAYVTRADLAQRIRQAAIDQIFVDGPDRAGLQIDFGQR